MNDGFFRRHASHVVMAVAGVFYCVVLVFTRNFPVADDYAVLSFVNRFVSAESPSRAFALLLEQHNEHRIITTKLAFLASLALTGAVNFKLIAVVGSFSYAAMYLLLVADPSERFSSMPELSVIVAVMAFQFGSAESLLFAMCGFSNLLVVVCALGAFRLAERDTPRALAALHAVCVLAVFTQGNGLTVPVLAAVQLASRRRYWAAASVGALAAALAVTYFAVGFVFPAHHSQPSDAYGHLIRIAVFTLGLLGSAFGLGSTHHPTLTAVAYVPAVCVGASVLAITALTFKRRGLGGAGALGWFLVFLLTSASSVALGRHTMGMSHALVSRYHIYSCFAIASALQLALALVSDEQFERLRSGTAARVLPGVSLLYLPTTFVLVLYFSFVQYGPARSGGIVHGDKPLASSILDQSERLGVFAARERERAP